MALIRKGADVNFQDKVEDTYTLAMSTLYFDLTTILLFSERVDTTL